jgi:hypothetical protein
MLLIFDPPSIRSLIQYELLRADVVAIEGKWNGRVEVVGTGQ